MARFEGERWTPVLREGVIISDRWLFCGITSGNSGILAVFSGINQYISVLAVVVIAEAAASAQDRGNRSWLSL